LKLLCLAEACRQVPVSPNLSPRNPIENEIANIAAIGDVNGDVNGDGISEVLAGAPGGGYALVISFGPGPVVQLQITFETGQPVISWPPELIIGVLESSPDLLNWEPVVEIDEVEESRYPIANETKGREQYYRIRFGE
jgi:hypothetical protein